VTIVVVASPDSIQEIVMTMTLVALACLGLAAEFAAGVFGWSRA
jgi:hypothetical protein